jgi:AraC-like DNA-binding protein
MKFISCLKPSPGREEDAVKSFMDQIPPFLKVYTDKSVVYLPAATGTGFSRMLLLEEGLSVRNLNFSLREDFEFMRLARKTGEEKTFQLYYFLDSINFHFSLNDSAELLSPATFSNILLVSNDLQIRGRFEKNETVKVIIISLSVSWLLKNGLDSMESCRSILAEGNTKDKGILMMQYPDIADHDIASEINQLHVPGNNFSLPVKANCLKLVERFFGAIEKRSHINLKESQAEHFLQMLKVEKALSEYLTTNLPLIKDLSRTFHMSESNLKKHFRIVYGKNIYEYYLEKKMELAKTMLLQENTSISKVAYSLGYEKVASFSKAFTKLYGILPSQFRTNLLAQQQAPLSTKSL